MSKQQSGIPALHHHDKIAESDYEKASMLNEFFSTCFITAVPPLSMNDDDFTVQNDRCPEELLCSAEEVLYFILSMDLQKANGPDGISAKMLKSVAHSITPSLTRLFNISIVQAVCLNAGSHLRLCQFQNQQQIVRMPTTIGLSPYFQ